MRSIARNVPFAFLVGIFVLVAVRPGSAEEVAPLVDGVVQPGEYAHELVDAPVHLFYTIAPDKIYIAIAGRTSGWVAVGLDSKRMDGARMYLGYYDGGKPAYSEQLGRAHRHGEAGASRAAEHAVLRTGDTTTMEIAVDRSAFLQSGENTLDVIYSLSSGDDITMHHDFRGSASLQVP